MAEVVTSTTQPAGFIESEAKLYLDQLKDAIGGLKGTDVTSLYGPEFVAGLSDEQKKAIELATSGIGAYKPYVAEAEKYMGPDAYKQFMSPYQKEVIDTTLKEFDIQAAKGLPSLAAQAYGAGAFGGGREAVQRAEYTAASDRNRAALQAQLLGQAYGQAQAGAATAYGQATGLAGLVPGLAGRDVAAMTTLGGITAGIDQAKLAAEQEERFKKTYFPLELAGSYGSGITPLISGYPGGSTVQTSPSPGALQTGISAGATLAGIYRLANT